MKTFSPNTFNKWKTYTLTFLAYVALHSMRMTYSQVKSDFQKTFNQTNLFLGLFDALVYISLACGFFFRFALSGNRKIIKSYFIFITIATLGYLIIPVTSLNVFFRIVLPSVGLLIFGFCQFPAWPTLLTLVGEHFDLKKEGKQMGTWSANGDIGNIIGFGLTSLLMSSFSMKWEYTMIVAASFHFVMVCCVCFFVKENEQKRTGSLHDQLISTSSTLVDSLNQPIEPQQSKFKKFIEFSKQTATPTSNKLYLLSMGLLKSILYGFLLWMPTYFSRLELKRQKSTIPIVFNAGTLVGSFILGYFYEHANGDSGSYLTIIRRHFRRFSLLYSCIGLTTTLTIFYCININIPAYYVLSVICGALLGGCFNMLASNQVIHLAGGDKEKVNMLSTLSMVCGNLMVGLVQIIIGVFLDAKNNPQGDKLLFIILMAVGAFTICVLFWRSKIVKVRHSFHIEASDAK